MSDPYESDRDMCDRLEAKMYPGDERMSSQAQGIIDAALSTPVPGLWAEVKWLLENAPCLQQVRAETNDWYRRRDALLGGRKP